MKKHLPQENLIHRIRFLEQKIEHLEMASRTLKESARRYNLLVDALNEGVIFLEAGGRIIIWNKNAENIFGMCAEEVIGRNFLDIQWPTIHLD
jgi:PAS domain-containing protein